MVGQHLGVVVAAAERLDPPRGGDMLDGTVRAGNLAVRDVADEDMEESVFALVRDRRAACALNESLSFERVEKVSGLVRRPPACDAADPEHLPVHGRVVQECLLLGRQPVEARRDDPLHRLGQRGPARAPALRDHLRVLLGVERIAAGASDQLSLVVGLEQRPWQHGPEQAGRLVIRERRERKRRSRSASRRPSSGAFRGARGGRCTR